MQDMSALFGTLTLALNTFHDKLSVELLTTTKLNNTCTTQLNSFGSILATESVVYNQYIGYLLLLAQDSASITYIHMGEFAKKGSRVIPLLTTITKIKYNLQRPRSVIIYFVMCAYMYQSLLKSIEHNIQNNQRHPQFRILR